MRDVQQIWQDLRYAARVLRQAPAFSLAAAVVLAIGVGANSAIFSLVDAVLLRPLPFSQPQQLVMLHESPPGFPSNAVSPLNFLDWSEQNRSFSSLAAVAGSYRALTLPNSPPEQIPGQQVSATLFDLLGISPVAGRMFATGDGVPGNQVVVISEGLWRSRFGANPALIGNTIPLDGQPHTVIGVAPAGFQLLYRADLWTPFVPKRSPEQRKIHYLRVIGRLKPGVTIEQARADMASIASRIARISPETNKNWTVSILPLRQALVRSELRVTSLALAGVAGFVLLMACANVANLMLARGSGRGREMAVRASLGGSQGRIFAQLLTESMLLAIAGGGLGIALAWAIVRAAPALLPPGTLPFGIAMSLDPRVLGFAVALTMLTGLLFGLAPALQAGRVPLAEALRAGGRSSTETMGRFRSILAVGQVAVAVMLVTGAGLLLRTLAFMYQVDPGYHAENVLTARVTPPIARYPTEARALFFYQAAERAVAALPGVKQAAWGGSLPLQGRDIGQPFYLAGQDPERSKSSASYQIVSAGYFNAMGISLIAGRAFTEHDTNSSTQVCIVNEEFVRRTLKGQPAIGARLHVSSMHNPGPIEVIREIVGVIHNVKADSLDEAEPSIEIYVPITQNPWWGATLIVRSEMDPTGLTSAVKAAVASVDKDLPVGRIRTMEQVASDSVAQPRFRAALVAAFASIAVSLAAVGIFGVLAFSVSQRTREFGVRMALGARTWNVMTLVLAGGGRIVLAGAAVGLAGSALLTRTIGSLLFGVKPLDPLTFAAAPILLAAVAILACAAPALRASRVDPAIALRQD